MYLLLSAFPERKMTFIVTDEYGVEKKMQQLYRSDFSFSDFSKEKRNIFTNYDIKNVVIYGPRTYIEKFEKDFKEDYPNLKIHCVSPRRNKN